MHELSAVSSIDVEDEVFADGNMAVVVRRGNEVRRGRTRWSEASHAVLRHLESVGFVQAPQFLGSDGEIDRFSFVPGETPDADLLGYRDDAVLTQVGVMIRDYHDAMASFVPPAGLEWPVTPGMPASDGTICHNDIAPWNVVFEDGKLNALIDWDLVAPATRAWDLAYAAWRFALLYPDEMFGSPGERVRRIHLLLDAYGMPSEERVSFPELILARMQAAYDMVEDWGAAGVPGFERLYRLGLHRDALDHIVWTRAEILPVW